MEKVIIDKIDVTDYANYWFDRCCEINSERSKYEQALQEIRDITKEWLNNDWSCYLCRSNMDEKLQDILAKINEVIGAE